MKNNYDEILAKATAPNTSNHERSEIYGSNPEIAAKLKQDVELSMKIGQLQQTGPDAKAAFKAVLNNITIDELKSTQNPDPAVLQATASKLSWPAPLKAYLPMAALLVVIGLVGIVWFRSGSQPTTNVNVPPVANGSISNANSTMIQDSTSEQINASSSDGTADIYTASANSLKRMGSSANVNF
ncbi:hypothetical protein HYX70_00435 [Candidatus Saccharibacteria bacterium]|nr:hypothetical protein [Candidatus Saccharibacteria bacterium]